MSGQSTNPIAAGLETVGQGNYVVKDGDSIDSIAFAHGFFPDTLWDLSENTELKSTRCDRNVLLPGDRVHIPPLRPKQLPVATGKRHLFQRRGVPAKFRIQVLDDGLPQAGVPYELTVEESKWQGNTDASGRVEHYIPPNARQGVLRVCVKQNWREHLLQFGVLYPIESLAGVQQRLANLGYAPGEITGEINDQTTYAISEFQRDEGLDESGELDPGTRTRLGEIHDHRR